MVLLLLELELELELELDQETLRLLAGVHRSGGGVGPRLQERPEVFRRVQLNRRSNPRAIYIVYSFF